MVTGCYQRHRCSKPEIQAAADFVATISTWQPENGRVLERAVPLLLELLQTEFAGAFSQVRTTDGWGLDFVAGRLRRGQTPELECRAKNRLAQVVASAPRFMRLTAVPQVEQNRVLSFREVHSEEDWERNAQVVIPILGFTKDCADLRVILAHRGATLGWCGVLQTEPFSSGQRAMFQKVVPALLCQAKLERTLGLSALHAQAFLTALQALPQPAYLLDTAARVVAANALGQRQLEDHRRTKHRTLCAWVREARAKAFEGTTLELPDVTFTVLTVCGMSEHYLLVERMIAGSVAQAVAYAVRKWELTKRQAEILRWVAEGETNKVIATRLACNVRSVEHHVSRLLTKTGFSNRAGLVANLLSVPRSAEAPYRKVFE